MVLCAWGTTDVYAETGEVYYWKCRWDAMLLFLWGLQYPFTFCRCLGIHLQLTQATAVGTAQLPLLQLWTWCIHFAAVGLCLCFSSLLWHVSPALSGDLCSLVCLSGRLLEGGETKLCCLPLLLLYKDSKGGWNGREDRLKQKNPLAFSFQGSTGIAFCLISGLGSKVYGTMYSVYFI